MRNVKWLALIGLCMGGALLMAPQFPRVAHSQDNPTFGSPLPGLTAEEMALFLDGKRQFEQIQEIKDGLGPGFNGRSCAECHSTPTTGGASAVTVVRFGRLEGDLFDGLERLGGTGLQMFAIEPRCQARVPSEANVIARRQTLPLYGNGLVEAIPDEAIIAAAEAQSDDIRGRVHWVEDIVEQQLRVGRFGWKAQIATLLHFSANAYLNEQGITSRFLPEDRAPNGDQKLLKECDRIPDPEDKLDDRVGLYGIDKFSNFMRLLAPPPRGPKSGDVALGAKLFVSLECALCHKPSYTTGPSQIKALDQQPVPAYSDFLLHDIGTGDNIWQGDATGREIRTTPLWGLRGRGPYLHDGSAATIEQAILQHKGQAQSARARFELLSTNQREALLAFLNSL